MNMSSRSLNLLLLLGVGLFAGCASQVPKEISEPAPGNLSLAEVRSQPTDFIGNTVRWGGVVIETRNMPTSTRITVLSYPLNRFGRPDTQLPSQGRFVAVFQGFVDPVLYSKQRALTVYGKLSATVTEKIDDYEYLYPVVQMSQHKLWEPVVTTDDDDYYFWPYGYYPYGHYHYYPPVPPPRPWPRPR